MGDMGMAWIAPIAVAAAEKEAEERALRELEQRFGGDWEFKVLRGMAFTFGNPDRRREALMEESAAGWQLAQQLDDNRLILRRPVTERESDVLLGDNYNPYRQYYGSGSVGLMALILGCVMLGAVGLLVFRTQSSMLIFVFLCVISMVGPILSGAMFDNNALVDQRRKRKG